MKNSVSKLIRITVILIFVTCNSIAQKVESRSIQFSWTDRSKLIEDGIKTEIFKFYISNLELRLQGQTVFKDKAQARLLDFKDLDYIIIYLDNVSKLNFDELKFNIGIDSITNSQGVQSGDLDPMNGMYWSWQSGYVNVKIEGINPNLTTFKKKFQYHLGGYLENQYAIQEINFKKINSLNPTIEIHLSDFFKDVNIQKENSIMIPGARAIALSSVFKNCFVIK